MTSTVSAKASQSAHQLGSLQSLASWCRSKVQLCLDQDLRRVAPKPRGRVRAQEGRCSTDTQSNVCQSVGRVHTRHAASTRVEAVRDRWPCSR